MICFCVRTGFKPLLSSGAAILSGWCWLVGASIYRNGRLAAHTLTPATALKLWS